ncbi:MAG: hypothetical protein KDK34_12205 [Leptospiraceae bacterium]|nr:hypothetical protein [Leptospiraceae bacterium]
MALLLCVAGTITRLFALHASNGHKTHNVNTVDECLVSEFYAELHEADFVDAAPPPRESCRHTRSDTLLASSELKAIRLIDSQPAGNRQISVHEEQYWEASISARKAAFRYYVRTAEQSPFGFSAAHVHVGLIVPVLMFESRVRTYMQPPDAHSSAQFAASSGALGVLHNQTTIGSLRNLYYSIRNGYVRRRIAHNILYNYFRAAFAVQSHSAILLSHYPSILKDLTCSTRSTQCGRTGHCHSLPSKHYTRSIFRRDGVRT